MGNEIDHQLLGLNIGQDFQTPFFRQYQNRRRTISRSVLMAPLLGLIGVLLIPVNANIGARSETVRQDIYKVMVTAYTNVAACTDSTPDETASLLRIKPKHYGKIIALSRDLARNHKYGDKFQLWINGKAHVVEYQDVMAKRFKNRIDLLLPSVKKSMRFGVNEGVLIPIERSSNKTMRQTG